MPEQNAAFSALEVVQYSFADLWTGLIGFLPQFLGALIVFLVGLIIAGLLGKFIQRIAKLLKLDELAKRVDAQSSFEKMGIKLHIGKLLGWIVKWFFIIVALIAAADILQWEQVTDFLREVVLYIPNVIIAVIILLVAVVLGNFVYNVVKTAVGATKLASSTFLAGISRWSIVVFGLMAALVQLGIAEDLIRILFTGFVAMLALAGGLAFGLGGKDHAMKVLNELKKDLTSGR